MDCPSTDLTFDDYLNGVDAIIEQWYGVYTDPAQGDWKLVGEAYAGGRSVAQCADDLAETLGLIETDPFIFPDVFPG
ncbi:hypothetical protein [Pacificispira sp.]|jgi:hypothetical protein|uniref:hypothetical protein n=1 Tax=Pacificispira sp. TaxID=2888761 RepID=UPI003B52ACF8